jgi:hypothetical protein
MLKTQQPDGSIQSNTATVFLTTFKKNRKDKSITIHALSRLRSYTKLRILSILPFCVKDNPHKLNVNLS